MPAAPAREGNTSRFVLLASAVVIIAALYFAQEVLIPLALALLLSFLLSPLCTRMERVGIPRILAVITVVLAVFAVVLTVGFAVYNGAEELARNLPDYQQNIVRKLQGIPSTEGGVIENVTRAVEEIGSEVRKAETPPAVATPETARADPNVPPTERAPPIPEVSIPPTATNPFERGLQQLATQIVQQLTPVLRDPNQPLPVQLIQRDPSAWQQFTAALAYAAGPIGTAGLVVVFVIFILLQRDDLRDRLIRLIGRGRLGVATQALDDAGTRITRYLTAQSIVNGTYGLAIALGLYLIGWLVGRRDPLNLSDVFPSFLLWGLLCAVLRFIPYLGPWLAAAFPILVSFAAFERVEVFFAVVALFVIVELLSNNLMEPWLYGASTGLSPVAVILAAVFWTWLWGVVGLLVATPLTACLVTVGKFVPQLGFLNVLLGDEPVLSPPVRLYQRLLALDQDEATDVIDDFVSLPDGSTRPLDAVYDEVVLPALALAERDRHQGKLDPERQHFIRSAVRDMIDHLGAEYDPVVQAGRAAKRAARRGSVDLPVAEPVEAGKVDRSVAARVKVVVLPAHDEADELAGGMVAQVLSYRGYPVTNEPVAKLASELVDAAGGDGEGVTVISAIPPAAFVHARYLTKRLVGRDARARIVVGLWNSTGDMRKARARLLEGVPSEKPVSIDATTTIAGVLEELRQHAYAIAPRTTAAPVETSTNGASA